MPASTAAAREVTFSLRYFKEYVRGAASSGGGCADELAKLAELRDRGVINDSEFQQQKAKLLA